MIIRERTASAIMIDAAAKVNLFLEVLHRRRDGFHEINSLFQAISLFDSLEVTHASNSDFALEIVGNERLEADETNLVTRAHRLMRDRYDAVGGLSVKLTKRIPMAAGLGGGSADASAMILACNELFGLNRDRAELAQVAAEIGSDCPFFFSDGQAIVSGRGDHMKPASVPVGYELVLITPGFGVSTAEAYADLRMGLTSSRDPFSLAYCRTLEELVEALQMSGNDFERTLFEKYPELIEIRDFLTDHGAQVVRLSGSGPTMFGVFERAPELERLRRFSRKDWSLCSAQSILFGTMKT